MWAMKMEDIREAAGWLAVVEVCEREQAGRHGVSVGVLRVLVRVLALGASGAAVGSADLSAAGLGAGGGVRGLVAELRRLGWVVPGKRVGSLAVSASGRKVADELFRSWERARKQVGRFEPAGPWGR